MGGITFSDFVLYFVIYSCMGWLCETIYCGTIEKKITNRGFLAGPYCPIYGFGALLVLLLLKPFNLGLPVLFLAAVVITTTLEYITSWVMEMLFGIRWWDYSQFKLNLNGRICLLNSVLFGILGVVMADFIHPNVSSLVGLIGGDTKRVVASFLVVAMLADLVTTLNAVYKLEEKLKTFQQRHSLHDEKFLKDITGLRLLNSFPKMKHRSLQSNLNALKASFEERKVSLKNHIWETTTTLTSKFATHVSDETISFASGLNGYKLFWVFFIASIVGYVVETLFCLVTRGQIESRQGLLYGPFSQVYGLGAVLLVLILSKLAKKSERWLFVGSMVVGGAFEFVCSLAQEKVLGTISWQYNATQISIGGRTSLTYMLFWGVLGVVFMREIYPRLSRFIERIPNKRGFVLTWFLAVMLTLDIGVSCVAVSRWAKRDAGVEPKNKFEVYIDNRYNDDMMKEIYPNMVMVK